MTYFYLSLKNDGKINDEAENVVLATLFAKSDTGLIKGDSSNHTTKVFMQIMNNKK